ncbi:MAG: hypothetical protein M1320_00575 [Patescibacteria group bacterium]|nr:hypothetical protein [Patescibacteria group bacterium]
MKKEIIIWQIIVLVLGIFMILIIKTYLENKIVVGAMKIQVETMAKRADCFMLTEEKNLSDGNCKSIDTTAYRLFEEYKLLAQ